MINDEHVISPILCTLQFREPLEYEAYPDQYEYYIPKIYNQDLLVQLLVSEDVKNDNAMWITLYDEEDNHVPLNKRVHFSSPIYYYILILLPFILKNQIHYLLILLLF